MNNEDNKMGKFPVKSRDNKGKPREARISRGTYAGRRMRRMRRMRRKMRRMRRRRRMRRKKK